MNTLRRAIALVGFLLIPVALFLDRCFDSLREKLGIERKHGHFKITSIQVSDVPQLPRRTKFAIGAAVGLALALCILSLAFPHVGALRGLSVLGMIGAAGTFARSVAPNQPLPQYSVVGVYTGGSSDSSPTSIALPAAFAALCVALGIAPTPNVLVVQALGNVTAGPFLTATNANMVLTYTTSGSGLTSFIATIGCFVPNSVTLK